jgi:hypothetical protein
MGSQSRAEAGNRPNTHEEHTYTGRGAKAPATHLLLIKSGSTAEKKKIFQEGEKEEKNRERERAQAETNTKKQGAKQPRASPSQPTKQQQQPRLLAARRAAPLAVRLSGGPASSGGAQFFLGLSPTRFRQSPIAPRSAQFPLFLGSDSVPSGARSSLPEIQAARALAGAGIMPPLL